MTPRGCRDVVSCGGRELTSGVCITQSGRIFSFFSCRCCRPSLGLKFDWGNGEIGSKKTGQHVPLRLFDGLLGMGLETARVFEAVDRGYGHKSNSNGRRMCAMMGPHQVPTMTDDPPVIKRGVLVFHKNPNF